MLLDSTILLHRDELTRKQWETLLRKLTFTDNDENVIEAFDHLSGRNVVRIPRGALDLLPELQVRDLRSCPKMPKVVFRRELDAQEFKGQKDAVWAMFENVQGQVIRPPATGKTNIALAFAAACETRTLVVVHTRRLFDQWKDELAIAVPDAKAGSIKGTECKIGHITIAMAQTLRSYIRAGAKFWRQFGALILDEEHHAAAETWEWILNTCPAYYRFGLTATTKRADGRDPLIRLLVGPVIHKHEFVPPYPLTIIPVESGFKASFNGTQYSKLLRQLCADEQRNKRIAEVALNEIAQGNSVVVLSEQIKHLEHIYDAIAGYYRSTFNKEPDEVALLTGRVDQRRQREVMQEFKDRRISCVLATRIFDEGLDVPVINRVILAFPGRLETPIIQRIGRALRKSDSKINVVVYDIVDEMVPVFLNQFKARKRTYKSIQAKLGRPIRYGEKERTASTGRKGIGAEQGRKLSDKFRIRRSART